MLTIAHIAAELHPVAKVGGLGDVVYGLAKEQIRQKDRVEILLPKYASLQYHRLQGLKRAQEPFQLKSAGSSYAVWPWHAEFDTLPLTLLEIEHPSGLFNRENIYGYPDDTLRFTLFCGAALQYLTLKGQKTDILHLHDWHTAFAAYLDKEKQSVARKSVITIHNAIYQGRCQMRDVELLEAKELPPPAFQDPFQPNLINLLKIGVHYADAVTTVSPTYAKQIAETQEGHGLQPLFHHKGVTGILNGIDYGYWNPESDPQLTHHYSASKVEEARAARAKNRSELQTKLGMNAPKGALVACITRLVPQKGPELIKEALLECLERGHQAILLGTSPPPDLLAEFSELAEQFKGQRDIHFSFRFDEALAHWIYGSTDILLVPSIFEPCGLTQMIAMRYGALPLVRETGGLADSVIDGETGFSFKEATGEAIRKRLCNALELYKNQPESWNGLLFKAAEANFTWTRSTGEYRRLYDALLKPTPS